MERTVILVTGSTDGIGKQAALEFARGGATVLLHGRNQHLGESVLTAIRHDSHNDRLELFIADFSSLAQIRQLAAKISARHKRLDVLVNNAGVYMRHRQTTGDGFETTFAVNHLAPFLLTNLLLDLMTKSAPSRIVNVSSAAHQGASLDFDNLQGEKRYEPYGAYSTSKLANLLFTYELARRLDTSGVTVNALHPGVIATKMLRASFGSMGGGPVEEGSARIRFLAESESVNGVTGKYFVMDKEQPSSPVSRDVALQKR
ncbi:MAG TPA: SDR family oxidoreductase, partial [Terriglobia bacterium]|nr:SDR family oxidoreductase [Terriglobia bacterium]